MKLLLFHSYSRQETNMLNPKGLPMSNSFDEIFLVMRYHNKKTKRKSSLPDITFRIFVDLKMDKYIFLV